MVLIECFSDHLALQWPYKNCNLNFVSRVVMYLWKNNSSSYSRVMGYGCRVGMQKLTFQYEHSTHTTTSFNFIFSSNIILRSKNQPMVSIWKKTLEQLATDRQIQNLCPQLYSCRLSLAKTQAINSHVEKVSSNFKEGERHGNIFVVMSHASLQDR